MSDKSEFKKFFKYYLIFRQFIQQLVRYFMGYRRSLTRLSIQVHVYPPLNIFNTNVFRLTYTLCQNNIDVVKSDIFKLLIKISLNVRINFLARLCPVRVNII